MTDALTLKHCFAADTSRPISDGIDLSAVLPALGAATAALPAAALGQVSDTVKTALDGLFAVSLADVLAASWGKVAGIRDAIEATRKDANTTALVPLVDHKITSQHKPHIDVTYGGKSLIVLPFDISLSLTLKGLMLELERGAISNVKAGTALGEGTVSFAGKKILTHKTRELALPGRLAFGAARLAPDKPLAGSQG
jgi:hypothetical protein